MAEQTQEWRPPAEWLRFVERTKQWSLPVGTGTYLRWVALGLVLASLVGLASAAPQTEIRAGYFLLAVLGLQFSGLVPLYCIGLVTPVLATVLGTMPLTPGRTAQTCISAMFNPMTALVLGSFSVHAISTACRLDVRFLQAVAGAFGSRPALFLLVLMLGCMVCSAVTLVTLMVLAAVSPLARKAPGAGGATLVLGVGIACTLGGVVTPIAGTPALVALSVLAEFGAPVRFLDWTLVALPTMTCVCVGAWAVLLAMFGPPPELDAEDRKALSADAPPLTAREKVFLGLAGCFLLGCTAQPWIEPWVGHAGNLALLLTALTFTVFLSRDDFLQLPWDVLAQLFGVNVIVLVLRESGLGLRIAAVAAGVSVGFYPLWVEVARLTAVVMVLASVAPHGIVATIVMPVVVALGFQLYAPVLVALLAVMAIACGVGTPYSSMDLLMTVQEMDRGGRAPARKRDFVVGGTAVTLVAWGVLTTVGFGAGMAVVGLEPPRIIRHEPAALQPHLGGASTVSRLRDLEQRLAQVEPRIGSEMDHLVDELEGSREAPGSLTAAGNVDGVPAATADWGRNATTTPPPPKPDPPWGWGNTYGKFALRGPDGELVPLHDGPPDPYSDDAFVHSVEHSLARSRSSPPEGSAPALPPAPAGPPSVHARVEQKVAKARLRAAAKVHAQREGTAAALPEKPAPEPPAAAREPPAGAGEKLADSSGVARAGAHTAGAVAWAEAEAAAVLQRLGAAI